MFGNEAARERASNVNAPEARQWLLTDSDTWVRNPRYAGPAQPHPEDEPIGFDDF